MDRFNNYQTGMNNTLNLNNVSPWETDPHKEVAADEDTSRYILSAPRIPKDFFITKGIGQSDITIHAGSYHLALREAGIEMCNIMVYSSILPKIATEIPKPESLTHGSVMECIMAIANSTAGIRATAAIMYGSLYHKETGEKFGGLVCEYGGSKIELDATLELRQSLNEIYSNGYSDDYDLRNIRTIAKSFTPEKKFGTAVVALCFTSYLHPIIK